MHADKTTSDKSKERRPSRPISKRRVLSPDDSLWTLVGAATDAPPSDSSRKHEYLAEGDVSENKLKYLADAYATTEA
jgi:hypothetical protein